MVAMGKTPSNLMKICNFWLTPFGESDPFTVRLRCPWSAGWLIRAGGGSFGREAIKAKILRNVWGVAVVKVTPPIGCVKYKAQHIVLPVRIPVLTGCKWPGPAKNKGFCCGFSPKAAKLTGFQVGFTGQ